MRIEASSASSSEYLTSREAGAPSLRSLTHLSAVSGERSFLPGSIFVSHSFIRVLSFSVIWARAGEAGRARSKANNSLFIWIPFYRNAALRRPRQWPEHGHD